MRGYINHLPTLYITLFVYFTLPCFACLFGFFAFFLRGQCCVWPAPRTGLNSPLAMCGALTIAEAASTLSPRHDSVDVRWYLYSPYGRKGKLPIPPACRCGFIQWLQTKVCHSIFGSFWLRSWLQPRTNEKSFWCTVGRHGSKSARR